MPLRVTLTFLLFLWSCQLQYPHSSYRMVMKVMAVEEGGYSCEDNVRVDWEVYGDTLRFAFRGVYMELLPLKDRECPEELLDYMTRMEPEKDEVLMVRKDENGFLYSIRIMRRNGLLIFISSLYRPYPQYVLCFSTTCECLEKI